MIFDPETEGKKNELNLHLRGILAIMDMIDGNTKEYPDYKENTLNENDYLDEQIKLALDIKERLKEIFK